MAWSTVWVRKLQGGKGLISQKDRPEREAETWRPSVLELKAGVISSPEMGLSWRACPEPGQCPGAGRGWTAEPFLMADSGDSIRQSRVTLTGASLSP